MTIKPWPFNNNRGSDLPYVKGSETSKAAADSIKHIAPSIEREVLGYFLGHMGIPNGDGFTDDELETRMQRSHQTVSARRRGLEQKGLIEKTGLKRKTRSGRAAMVYKIIDGLTPDEMHNELLCQCYGSEEVDTKFGIVRRPVKRSNDATRGDYSELIETLCRVAAEMGFDVPPPATEESL